VLKGFNKNLKKGSLSSFSYFYSSWKAFTGPIAYSQEFIPRFFVFIFNGLESYICWMIWF